MGIQCGSIWSEVQVVDDFCCFRVPNFWVWSHRRLYPDQELLIHHAQRLIACSDGALQQGVRPGQSLSAAQALAQNALSVAVDYPCAEMAWEEWLESLYQVTPFLWPQQPDFCWARLERSQARQLAFSQGVALGIAADRSTAQLASLVAEQGQMVVVPAGQEQAFADRIPVTVLLHGGIAWVSLERLHWLGFARVGELRRLSESQLRQRFHDGSEIYRLSRPGSRQQLGCWTPPEERVGELACEPGACMQSGLVLVLQKAYEQLGDFQASRMTLELEYPDQLLQRAARWLKQPTANPGKLSLALQPLWRELQQPFEPERIRLRLGGLRLPQRHQGSLWLIRPSIKTALQQIHQRFPGMLKQVAWHPGPEGVSEESWSLV